MGYISYVGLYSLRCIQSIKGIYLNHQNCAWLFGRTFKGSGGLFCFLVGLGVRLGLRMLNVTEFYSLHNPT